MITEREFHAALARRGDLALRRGMHPDFVASRLRNALARRQACIPFASLSKEQLLDELLPVVGGATNFELTLDTTAPAGVTISLAGGAAYATQQAITATIATSDGDTTGYQMKVWGDVDEAANANIQNDEGDSAWVAFNVSQAVTLSTGDGSKTLSVKVRDDVWNESGAQSDSITLDTTLPTPTVSVGPDVTRVSKISGKRVASFSWQSNAAFEEYKIKVVPASGSLHSAGTAVPETNSTNMDGAAGGYPATTNIDSTLDGRDLETASAGDGAKVVKVFVKDAAGNWSV